MYSSSRCCICASIGDLRGLSSRVGRDRDSQRSSVALRVALMLAISSSAIHWNRTDQNCGSPLFLSVSAYGKSRLSSSNRTIWCFQASLAQTEMSLLRSPSKKQPTPLPSAEDSLLIPANPALVNPGSSPTSRGGILLNPLGGDKDSGSHLRGTSPGGGGPAASGGSRPGRWLSRTTSSMSSSTTNTVTSSTSGSSQNTSVESTAATSVAPSNASSSSPSLKFAPLPVSGRKRSSSIACTSEPSLSIELKADDFMRSSLKWEWLLAQQCCKVSMAMLSRNSNILPILASVLLIGNRTARLSDRHGITGDLCLTSRFPTPLPW